MISIEYDFWKCWFHVYVGGNIGFMFMLMEIFKIFYIWRVLRYRFVFILKFYLRI